MENAINEKPTDNNEPHMWMAVMDRAVRDLVALERFRNEKPEVLEDPVFRYDYRTLIKWFRSPSMEPGAFNWICSLVNIDQNWAITNLEKKLGIGIRHQHQKEQSEIPYEGSEAIAA
jgi:hypothetical protein